MQMQTRSGSPALQNGLLFGVILGAIEVVLSLTLGNVGFLICLIFYLGIIGFAGYRASARTARVSTGLVAGLLAGLFSSIIGSLGLFLYLLPNLDTLRQQLQQQAATLNQGVVINYTNNVVIGLVVFLLVIMILGSSLLALGIGAIGGAIGKGKAPVPHYPYPGNYPDPRYMPPPAYPPQEYIPPQNYPPLPQNYPPSPEDYMSPPPEK